MRFIAILLTQEIGYRDRDLSFAVLASSLIVFADMQILANIQCPSHCGAIMQILANIRDPPKGGYDDVFKRSWQLLPAPENERRLNVGISML